MAWLHLLILCSLVLLLGLQLRRPSLVARCALRDCAPGPLHTLLPLPSRSLPLVSICFRCQSLPGFLLVPALGFLKY